MIDQDEEDDKIIAVALNDMSVNHYNDISELPQHLLQQIHRFFEDYKKLENKEVKVKAFENRESAVKIVKTSIDFYRETFPETTNWSPVIDCEKLVGKNLELMVYLLTFKKILNVGKDLIKS